MNEDGFISFQCEHCKTEIEATPDLIGETTECPACGMQLIVPDNRDDGVKRHNASETDEAVAGSAKSRTIRIELGDL